MEVAGRLFAERGYDGVTVREICQRAAVNISAINYYFRDKQTLYLETVRTAARHRIKDIPLVTWSVTDPAELKLQHFIRNMLQRVVADHAPDWQAQLLMSEIVRPTKACQRFIREFVRPNFQLLLEILQELAPQCHSRRTLFRLAFSIVAQCVYYRLCRSIVWTLVGRFDRQFFDLNSLAQHITDFSLAGIQAVAKSARKRSAALHAPAHRG